MKNKNRRKTVLLVLLIILILGMAIGYAAFSQTLTINGTANISSSWDIHFNSITEGAMIGATSAEGYPKIEDDTVTATFDVTLDYPGASATYVVEVHNNGTVPAVLESIGGTMETVNAAAPTSLTFECDAVVGDTLDADQTKQYNVTATWAATDSTVPVVTNKTVTITLNYAQDTTQD